jgi:hypothetical protein
MKNMLDPDWVFFFIAFVGIFLIIGMFISHLLTIFMNTSV